MEKLLTAEKELAFSLHLVRDQSVLTDVMKSLRTVGNSPDMKVNHFIEGEVNVLSTTRLCEKIPTLSLMP